MSQQDMLYDANKKSTGVAYLLLLFLGSFGAHRFCLGKTGLAVTMLVLTIVGRVDKDGRIYEGSNFLTENAIGRIDEDGTIFKGTNAFTEERIGRVGADGTVYSGGLLVHGRTGRAGGIGRAGGGKHDDTQISPWCSYRRA